MINELFFIVGPSGEPFNLEKVDLSDQMEFDIRLNPDHVIYKAHFPGHPVTPGVCIIKIINEVLEVKMGCRLTLTEVKNLKFVVPIEPLKQDRVTLTFQSVDGYHAKGIIASGTTVYTKFSLIFDKE